LRQDWDFVTIADYQADMRETAEQAAGIISSLKESSDGYKRALAAAVLAAGGEVTVPENHLNGLQEVTLEVWRNPSDDTLTFKARRVQS
jgi:hypothetical protein